MVTPTTDRSEIAFFDLETTVPTRPGQGFAILEFGSILVCPKKLIEVESYETLVKPHDMSLISSLSVRANGITADAVISAPSFSDVADKVYDLLHGRIWAGHNILRFDCVRLREAFSQINRAPPEPKGTIDSLALLTQRFGRRAGDMKMASLAAYFGLGKQSHRSLDDVRMNFEVLKYCATVLFLESSLPDIFTENSWISPNATTRNRSNARAVLEGTGPSTSPPSSSRNIENQVQPGSAQVQDQVQPGSAQRDPFDLGPLIEKIENEPLQSNEPMDEESSTDTPSRAIIESTEFLELDQVSITSVTVSVVPFFRGPQKIQILHNNTPLQIHCSGLKVRFGLSTRFVDHAGRPRLNFVVDVSSNLCGILDACDDIAKRFVDSDSNSEWRPVVNRKPGFYNSPTIRLQLPSITEGDSTRWTTEIYQKSSSSPSSSSPSSLSIQQVVFNRYDVSELEALIRPGSLVDAYFSLEPYDYQQNAGIRLVAKKLIVESN